MAEKANAKAKPAPKGGGKASKGKGKKSGGNLLSWVVVAGLAAGLAWVVWPFFGAPPAPLAATPQKQTSQQVRQLSVQNPEAEVFNPGGNEAAAPAPSVKKK